MANINKTITIGRLTRDPEIRSTPRGTAVAEFGLAVNREYRNDAGEKKEDTTYINFTAWGKVAELIGKYCHRSDPVYIEGRLSTDKWEDKQTGEKRAKTVVVVETIQFLGGKRSDGEPAGRKEESNGPEEW